MKRGGLVVFGLFLIINFLGFTSADACTLNASLINQDPYPAIPGESVKVIFQIDGVSNPICQDVYFEVKENFPFTVDPSSQNPITISSGTYVSKYSSFYLAPYKIRIDKSSLEGDIPIEVSFSSGGQQAVQINKEFNINVKDVKANFEVYVKNYNENTKKFTLEILNIAKSNIKALTIEIPQQDNFLVRGANRVVVGSLDSNEYTTADFEGTLKKGNLNLNIFYTDLINERREINKTIYFDPATFDEVNEVSQPIWLYILIPILIIFAGWMWYRAKKAKKKRLR
ncbi:Uncharacterised protein [uncultured archaeon]|nr:Uncharacterised protein [uncultured archaeon]